MDARITEAMRPNQVCSLTSRSRFACSRTRASISNRTERRCSRATWDWLRSASQAHCLLPGEPFPWDEGVSVRERLDESALIAAPVFEPDGADPVGGVVLVQRARAAWGGDGIASSVPAIQTLASQIGSALHGAELYCVEQELSLAGQIQASFLPQEPPQIPGWHVTAALEPAQQTAGDFYDVIPLPNERFGLVVADVAGKRMGAALYMALA